MSDWWTYRLSDFLLFSPQTYYRLFELHNEAVWPAQIAAFAASLAVLALLRRPGAASARIVAGLLAAAWFWVAWSYHRVHYAPINWAAEYYAIGFAAQALLLLGSAAIPGRLVASPDIARAWFGFGIAAFAILLQPLLAPVLGRPWPQAEIFGIAPDPTAIATLGILLAMQRLRWELMILPLLWSLVSGATLWAMEAPEAFMLPGIALLTIALAIRKAR